MRKLVIEAFLETRDGFSPDRVLADPALNDRFLAACRRKGTTKPSVDLNLALLNARKASELKRLHSIRTTIVGQDQFRFASEVAIRFLERRDGISLDLVLCDPDRALEFDRIASSICPGHLALEYRWAALGLRKKRELRPELVSRIVPRVRVSRAKIANLEAGGIPIEQGVYVLQTSTTTLYVGEAENLRKRLAKHLDHSDRKGLARWLWDNGFEDLFLELHVEL
jgi:site-specific DNA-methyltransferase (adenine-specific)